MSVALVPIKALSGSKSRLLPELEAHERASLALAMLEDVLAALLATPAIDRVVVATPDDRAAEAARKLGAEVLHGPDDGLNAAIDTTAAALGLADDEPYLVVLGDVAGAEPAALGSIFVALAELGATDPRARCGAVVLVPSRDGGTSALLRCPHDAIPSLFGRQSAARHRAAALAADVPLRELPLAALAIDLDRADDVSALLDSGYAGPRTRALLDALDWPHRTAGGRP